MTAAPPAPHPVWEPLESLDDVWLPPGPITTWEPLESLDDVWREPPVSVARGRAGMTARHRRSKPAEQRPTASLLESAISVIPGTLLIVALAVGWYIDASTYRVSSLWPQDRPNATERVEQQPPPVNVPSWTPAIAAVFPDCEPKDGSGHVAPYLVVVDQGDDTSRMPFKTAYRRNTDDQPGNDVWVVGYCQTKGVSGGR